MLKHCGNYAAIYTNKYASFLHQKCFSDLPKDIILYCRSQNMNIQKHWYTPYLLRIDTSAFKAFRRCNTSWWTQCHWHNIHTLGTWVVLTWYATWAHPFFRKISYYVSIMPQFKSCRFCLKLCWHNKIIPKPTTHAVYPIVTTTIRIQTTLGNAQWNSLHGIHQFN